MSRHKFYLTTTAREQIKIAVRDAKKIWGQTRAEKYNADFQAGLDKLAQTHTMLRGTFRSYMTQGTPFHIHRLEQHYVVFVEHDALNLIIVGVFHEKMDLPSRLHELALMTADEIGAIKERIARTS